MASISKENLLEWLSLYNTNKRVDNEFAIFATVVLFHLRKTFSKPIFGHGPVKSV